MPNRTIYLCDEQVAIWEDMRMYAKVSDVSVATLLLYLFEKHVSIDTRDTLRKKRIEIQKLVTKGRK